jgi:hypothetical protein
VVKIYRGTRGDANCHDEEETNVWRGGGRSLGWDGENEWPGSAVRCEEKRVSRVEGGRRITNVLKCYTMADGSVETKEYSSVDLV